MKLQVKALRAMLRYAPAFNAMLFRRVEDISRRFWLGSLLARAGYMGPAVDHGGGRVSFST